MGVKVRCLHTSGHTVYVYCINFNVTPPSLVLISPSNRLNRKSRWFPFLLDFSFLPRLHPTLHTPPTPAVHYKVPHYSATASSKISQKRPQSLKSGRRSGFLQHARRYCVCGFGDVHEMFTTEVYPSRISFAFTCMVTF